LTHLNIVGIHFYKELGRLKELQREEEMEKRRQLVHKARPFKQPRHFDLMACEKALTVPQSPAFHPFHIREGHPPQKSPE
jgi:hypothetical protein